MNFNAFMVGAIICSAILTIPLMLISRWETQTVKGHVFKVLSFAGVVWGGTIGMVLLLAYLFMGFRGL